MRRIWAAWRRIVCTVRGHRGRRFGDWMRVPLSGKTVRYNGLPVRPGEHIVWRHCKRCGALYGMVEKIEGET